MKKIASLCLALVLGFMLLPAAGTHAETCEPDFSQAEQVVYFEDGSFMVTVVNVVGEQGNSRASGNTRTGNKTTVYYNSDGIKLFSLTVYGVFTYNGTTATCTSSSFTYEVFDSSWSFKSATASKSGASATATGTFVKKVLGITTMTRTLTPTLTCDKNGNLS